MSPLTHHDILRLARPLVTRDLRVDLAHCDRERRLIVFQPTVGPDTVAVTTLESIDEDTVELVRATAIERVVANADDAASARRELTAIACLSARVDIGSLDDLAAAFDVPEAAARWRERHGALAAFDEVLVPNGSPGQGNSGPATRAVRSVELLCPPLRVTIDASTTGGTPADLWLTSDHAPAPMRRPTLASGAPRVRDLPAARRAMDVLQGDRSRRPVDAATDDARIALLATLPDDLLAVATPRLRVLRWQGDHWKGALALPAAGERRRASLDDAVDRALVALTHLLERPATWHETHRHERWRVFARRLKPLAALGAILAVMPIAWLAVTRGGVELHPLLLGITPLLMVFMIALSAREIPVMEWPPRPRPPTNLHDRLRQLRGPDPEPATR